MASNQPAAMAIIRPARQHLSDADRDRGEHVRGNSTTSELMPRT
jgi:hypothetical protein